jgi:hypothetical protein
MPKTKRHLHPVPDPLDRDEPVKLPDDFAEAVRAVLPTQATSESEPDEDDAR